MEQYGSFKAAKRYFDDTNFPYGFKQSGDFTRVQAETLELCGATLYALEQNKQEPLDETQQRFISVCRGEIPAESDIEKAWVTYREALIRKGRTFNLFTSYVAGDDDDFDNNDDDLDD
jgi:uncharacterized protein YifE (UPF0438 family)